MALDDVKRSRDDLLEAGDALRASHDELTELVELQGELLDAPFEIDVSVGPFSIRLGSGATVGLLVLAAGLAAAAVVRR